MRLIDADLLDKLLEAQASDEWNRKILPCSWAHALDDFRDMLDDAPTIDAVEVVRCEDCKHSYENLFGFVCAHGVCVDCIVPNDFYCAEGERKI